MARATSTTWWLTLIGIVTIAAGVVAVSLVPPLLPPDGWPSPGLVGTCAGLIVAVGVFTIALGQLERSSTSKPLTQVEMLASPLTATETLLRLQHQVQSLDGTLEPQDSRQIMRASFGSRLALRLWGVMTKYGVDRLPYILDAKVDKTTDGAQVRLTFTSDEGWYLIRMRMVENAYTKRFDYIAAVMQSGLTVEVMDSADDVT